MTKSFNSLEGLATHFAAISIGLDAALTQGLGHAVSEIRSDARGQLGHYQPAVGPFVAWAPLSPETIEERVQKGYSPNDPLLRSGSLRSAIDGEVSGLEGVVGVKSGQTNPEGADLGDVAVDMELGTASVPPRPFLGPAAVRQRDRVSELLIGAVVTQFSGRE